MDSDFKCPDGTKKPIRRVKIVVKQLAFFTLTVSLLVSLLSTAFPSPPVNAQTSPPLPACTTPAVNTDWLNTVVDSGHPVTSSSVLMLATVTQDFGSSPSTMPGTYLFVFQENTFSNSMYVDDVGNMLLGFSTYPTNRGYRYDVNVNGSLTGTPEVISSATHYISCFTTYNIFPDNTVHTFPYQSAVDAPFLQYLSNDTPPPDQAYAFEQCDMTYGLSVWQSVYAGQDFAGWRGIVRYIDSSVQSDTPLFMRVTDDALSQQEEYAHYDVYHPTNGGYLRFYEGENATLWIQSDQPMSALGIIVSNSPWEYTGSSVVDSYGASTYPANTPIQIQSDTNCVSFAEGAQYDSSWTTFAQFQNADPGDDGLPPATEVSCSATDIGCHLRKLGSFIVNGIAALFVPDNEMISDKLDHLATVANAKFGVLLYPIEFIGQLFAAFITPSGGFCSESSCNFSPGTFVGMPLSADFGFFSSQVPVLWTFLRYALQAGLVITLIWWLRHKYMEVLDR